MKKTLTHLILAGFTALAIDASADIVYKDVNPDETFSQTSDGQSTYSADLNTDGVIDFEIIASHGPYQITQGSFDGDAVVVRPLQTGNGVLTDGTLYQFAQALNSGSPIQSTSTGTWKTDFGILSANGTVTPTAFPIPQTVTGGNFTNTTDKYIAVRFMIGSTLHYGWIRVDVTGYNTFVVKDMAYEDVADQMILAGETVTGLSKALAETTLVKTNPNSIELEFANVFNGKVTMMNQAGQVSGSVDVAGKTCIISTAGLSTGIYTLMISGKEGYAAKKVIVQ